jgi:hypothetical protein
MYELFPRRKLRHTTYDKAAPVIRAEYHGPSAASGRPKPALELTQRFYNSISDGDLYCLATGCPPGGVHGAWFSTLAIGLAMHVDSYS